MEVGKNRVLWGKLALLIQRGRLQSKSQCSGANGPGPKALAHRTGALEQQGGPEAAPRGSQTPHGDGGNSPERGRAGRHGRPMINLKAVMGILTDGSASPQSAGRDTDINFQGCGRGLPADHACCLLLPKRP